MTATQLIVERNKLGLHLLKEKTGVTPAFNIHIEEQTTFIEPCDSSITKRVKIKTTKCQFMDTLHELPIELKKQHIMDSDYNVVSSYELIEVIKSIFIIELVKIWIPDLPTTLHHLFK